MKRRTPRRAPPQTARARWSLPIVAGAVLALLVGLSLLWYGRHASTGSSHAGPIILISIDTLRADHLPAYGYTGVATPHLDALARDSAIFERAYSHSPQTLPAHASILTGELPFEHGVRDNIGFSVKPNQRTLPQLLGAHGYGTAGFVSSFVLRQDTGVGQGFALYDSEMPPAAPGAAIGQVQRDGGETLARVERWLDGQAGSRFFLFFHLYEPHTPYRPPARFARYSAYDGEIAYADEIVGRLLDSLKRRALYDAATIVVLSDHGEGLGDHGEREHGVFIYDESIRVPLIVKLPDNRGAGRRASAPVQHVDVAPTLLDLAGVARPAEWRGRSLRPLLEDGVALEEQGIYSESMYPRYHFGWSELTSLTDARYRFIKAPRTELYDLTSDPRETNNLAGARAQTEAAMGAALDRLTAGRSLGEPSAVSNETRERLQALGYVGTQSAVGAAVPGVALADPKDKVHVLEAYRRAIDFANERRFAEAVPVLRGILQTEPGMADVWQQLGNILSRLGRQQEAVDAFKRFVTLKPDDPGGLVLVAGTLMRMGRLDEAWSHAQLAAQVAPAHDRRARGSAYETLARIALRRNDPEAARRAAAEAHAADPSLPMPQYVQGRLLHMSGRYAEALPHFEEALRQLDARNVTLGEIHYYTGDTLARLERHGEAETRFRREVALFPQNSRAWAGLAMLYRATGRNREAEQAIADLLSRVPTAEAHGLAADLWTMFGEPQRAAAVRERARRLEARR
ncbi:MAG: sulfatase-like hydrolase/transferase [Vicinamibacterales bacterium]